MKKQETTKIYCPKGAITKNRKPVHACFSTNGSDGFYKDNADKNTPIQGGKDA